MSDNQFPGVNLIERSFDSSAPNRETHTAAGAFIGQSDQGPLTATAVTSWSNFTSLYGRNFTELHYAVHDFYNNGGREAYIVRDPGLDAAVATLEVYEASIPNPPDVGDVPLFTVTSSNPGAWGNRLHLDIDIRDEDNHRFDVTLYDVPNSVTFDPAKSNSQYVVDRWSDVTLMPGDSRNLYAVANKPSQAGSHLVVFSGTEYDPEDDLTWVLPGMTGGGHQFADGADGTYAGAYSEETAYSDAVTALDEVVGPLVLNLPGMRTAAVVRGAVETASSRGDMFVVVDTDANISPSGAVSFAGTDLSLNSLGATVPSFAAVYYPWVYVPLIGTQTSGQVTLRPPGGSVVGAMMRTDANTGPWRAPAGIEVGRLGRAVAPERSLQSSDLATLNNGNVNAVRSIPGAGVTVMGARTLKKFGKDRYVNVRRNLMYISASLKTRTEFVVFRNNDRRLWLAIEEEVSGFLGGVWQNGGLRGSTAAEAFYVKCDADNNPPSSIDEGAVNIDVGVSLLVPAEFINITITQFEGGSSVAVDA